MPGQFRDNDSGDRLASATMQTFKCSKCGNMYSMAQANCDVCGFHCEENTCEILDTSNEDY
jgi:hypothetical protein